MGIMLFTRWALVVRGLSAYFRQLGVVKDFGFWDVLGERRQVLGSLYTRQILQPCLQGFPSWNARFSEIRVSGPFHLGERFSTLNHTLQVYKFHLYWTLKFVTTAYLGKKPFKL